MMNTPGNSISSSGPFFTLVPPMTPTQNCRCASRSRTARWTCPIRRPSWFGSTSCANAGDADSNANTTNASLFCMEVPSGSRHARLSRRNGGAGRHGAAFTNLLPPHRVVKTFLLEQLLVCPELDDASTLEDVDAIGVHDRRQPVRNQDRDHVLVLADFTYRAADFFFGERV